MPTITPSILAGTGTITGFYRVRVVADAMEGVGGVPIYANVQILLGPSGSASVEVTPGLEIVANGGGAGDATFAAPTVEGSGLVGQNGNGVVAFPVFEVEGFAGGKASLEGSGLVIEAQASVAHFGNGDVILGEVEVQGVGTQHNVSVSTDITVSPPTVSARGYQDGSGRADIAVSGLSVLGVGAAGPIGECLVLIEYDGLPVIDASGWIFAMAQGSLSFLPELTLEGAGRRPNRFEGLILRYEDEYQP